MEENKDFEMSMFNNDNIELNLNGVDDAVLDFLKEGEEQDEIETPEDEAADDESSEDVDENNSLDDDSEEESGGSSQEDEDLEKGDDSNASPNFYSSLATVLNEQGLLPNLNLDENKVESIEDFTKLMQSQIQNQVKDYLVGKIGEEGFDALEKGISLLDYQQYQDNVQTLDSITEESLTEDLELSKNIILQDYLQQGMSQERAMRILNKTIDLGEEAILEDAKLSLTSLKEFESVRLEKIKTENLKRQKEAIKEQEKIDNDLKNSIYKSEEIIPGIKLGKQMQDKIYQSITKIVSESPEGVMENKLMHERRKNPIEFDTKLYYLYELTNGFNDFSKLVSKSQSKAINDLEKSLRQTSFKDSGKPSYMDDNNSYDGSFGSELVF